MGIAFPKDPPKDFGRAQEVVPMTSLQELLGLVFASGRLQILQALEAEPLRFTQVAKRLKISESEVSRNLKRLLESGLVSKRPQGSFRLTPTAHIVLGSVPAFSFLAEQQEFVNGHAVHQLPPAFLRRLDDLANARVVNDPFTIYGHLEHMFRNLEERFDGQWIIGKGLGQQQLELHQLAKRRLAETHAKARTVMLRSEMPTMLKQSPDFLQHFETRVLDAAPTSVAATEKAAVVWFEDLEGRIDFSYALIGDDERFLAWTRDLFDHYWDCAESVLGKAPARSP